MYGGTEVDRALCVMTAIDKLDRMPFHAHTTHSATGASLCRRATCLEQFSGSLARLTHYIQQFQA